MNYDPAFKISPLFQDIEPAALDHLHRRAVQRDFAPGETVVLQGPPQGGFYLIRQGVCHVVRQDTRGTSRHLGFRFTGNQMGLAAALAQEDHYASAVAYTHVQTLWFTTADMVNAMWSAPHLIQNSFKEISARFHTMMERQQGSTHRPLRLKDPTIANQASRRLLNRVAAFLAEWVWVRESNDELLASAADDRYRLGELRMPHQHIADLLFCDPAGVSRAIGYLVKNGYLVRAPGKMKPISFIDADRLHQDFCPYLSLPGHPARTAELFDEDASPQDS